MAEWVEPGAPDRRRIDSDSDDRPTDDRTGDGLDVFDSGADAPAGDVPLADDDTTGYHDTVGHDDTAVTAAGYDDTADDRYGEAQHGDGTVAAAGGRADLTKSGTSSAELTEADHEAGQRGSLGVKDKVVEKMATRAALDVPGVARHGSGFDRLTGREFPRVNVRVAGGHVRVDMEIAVTWPYPLADVGATVREEVGSHLARLSGLRVDAVNVAIPTIVTPSVDTAPTRSVQ